MKLEYVFIDQYEEPAHIRTYYHNCYELVYYHRSNGYITYKPAVKKAPDALVFTQKEEGVYSQINFSDRCLLLIPPNVLHDEKHYTESKLMAVGFSLDEEDEDVTAMLSDKPLLYRDDTEELLSFVQRIEKEYSRQSPLYQKIIELLITRLIILMSTKQKETRVENLVAFAQNYIDEHFASEINFDDLAKQANYSPDHFRVIFKEQFGETPK